MKKTMSKEAQMDKEKRRQFLISEVKRMEKALVKVRAELDEFNKELVQGPEKVKIMGMAMDKWTYASCEAFVATNDDMDKLTYASWATVYTIESKEPAHGHATALLRYMREYYEGQHKAFGSSIALNDVMRHVLKKLGINEYK